MFIYTLAHNASNRDVQERFEHSAETGCVGAIDVTHIPIMISLDKQDPYRNRKQRLSQNVMVACDFDLRFVYVRAGWEGSASDARILQHSIKQGFEVPRGKYYLVDAGYANTLNFIAPYKGVRYHLQEQGRAQSRPSNYKELFNLRYASLRNHVERIISIFKIRFLILKVATFHPIDSQTGIVVAAYMFHNFICIHNGTYVVEDFDNEVEETIVPNGDESYGEDVDTMNSERNTGARKIDEIAMQMWSDYCSYRRD
ncbi:putative nuclease HARBI1 [Dioscorea cayenensis subsp. rotundata]|uniref:Nuclease HARBI1 n=1 Tax=Dioscorea cayennensis subsp. rotundata TaxID=55577 RepID=A0AB40AUT7_DIOCR|nr:putative nuclease HARBI1 [Dioscorea cayenensis subsp. rotundata]